jgi:integrase
MPFCRFVEDHGWLRFDGLARVSTADKKAQRKRALTRDEVKRLLEYLLEKSPTVWHPIVYTLLHTGLRSKELIFLEWDDVDLEGGSVRVRPKPHLKVQGDAILCKSKSNVRAIPISNKLREVLGNLPNRRGFVFPTEDGNHRWNNFYRDFMATLKMVPLNRVEEITPHVMRHTFISHLLVYGKQDLLTVSRLAGHSSIETTQIYLHLIGGDEQKRNAVESLPSYED